MKLITTLSSLLALFVSLSVSAAWSPSDGDWANTKAVAYTSGGSDTLEFSLAKDAHGNSRFYISAYYSDANICSPEQFQGSRVHNVEVSGVLVRFYVWCLDGGEQYYSYLSMTPATDNGFYHVVNTFLKSNQVTVNTKLGDAYSKAATVTASGFTKAWNDITTPAL